MPPRPRDDAGAGASRLPNNGTSGQPQDSAVLTLLGDEPMTSGRRAAVLHDDIYAVLRHNLISGALVPGQRVSIRTLAETFGTSLVPVRDALKRLVAEHALLMLPNRTVRVPMMTRERFQELLQARLALETMLTRRAAERITHDKIAALDAVNDSMQFAVQAGDVKSYLAANYAFHFGLYAAAGSSVILPMVEMLWVQAGPFLNALFNDIGTRNAGGNHREVVKALRRRDAVGAASAINADLADAADLILATVDFHVGDPSPPRTRTRRSAAARARDLVETG
jgi:DNA-binding GntR family transcriptional regulator